MISAALKPPRHDRERDASVWHMWTRDGMTQAQIGAALGVTAQRVSAILLRYREALETCSTCGQGVERSGWSADELAELTRLPALAGAAC